MDFWWNLMHCFTIYQVEASWMWNWVPGPRSWLASLFMRVAWLFRRVYLVPTCGEFFPSRQRSRWVAGFGVFDVKSVIMSVWNVFTQNNVYRIKFLNIKKSKTLIAPNQRLSGMNWIQKFARLTSKYCPKNLTTAHILKGSHKSLQN